MGQGLIRIAGLQFAGLRERKERNLATALEMISQAADAGAQIVLAPEVVMTGFVGGESERRMAETVPGPTTEALGTAAAENNVYVIAGLSELREGQVYNAMAILGPDGALMGVMRKVHINKFETGGGWRNGSEFPVWNFATDTGCMTAGIMICYDREVPESARILMLKGAEVILNPLACTCPTDEVHRCLLRTRAFENEAYVLVVNHAAPRLNGHSMFIGYDGNIVSELDENPGILMAEVDLDALAAYRENGIYSPHHRRPGLYDILSDPSGQMHPTNANLPPR